MTATVTDLFCGAGGSSTGAAAAGATIVMAANHWQTAIDVHQAHHPDAAHDCADITQVDPRRYPRTDILIASPECTNHSQARGVSRRRQDPTLWDAPDPSAERSRATMWDVVRFAEQMHYAAVVVENVVEATKWVLWPAWTQAMRDLGYELTLLSHNSMHHGVPQSRDRIYAVWLRAGLRADLDLELAGWCARCDAERPCRQAWKGERRVGRYRQQYRWACTTCGGDVEPATEPAASIIDWTLPTPRIGDRARPLAPKTRARIYAGLKRHGWVPVTTAGAGNVWEQTPGMRARPVTDPTATMQTTATQALATPPGFLFQTAHEGRVVELDQPHPTVTASDDRHSLVLANTFDNVPTTTEQPLPTATTGGRLGLVVPMRRNGRARPTDDPVPTVTAGGSHHALIVRNTGHQGSGDLGRFTRTSDDPLPTMVASTSSAALIMRNNQGGGEMVTPVEEPIRTVTTKGHQSLLVPYYGTGVAQPVTDPVGTIPTRDRWALLDPDEIVDDCGFRMLEPFEIAAAMAFPAGYIPTELTKRDQVKLAGNAVNPAGHDLDRRPPPAGPRGGTVKRCVDGRPACQNCNPEDETPQEWWRPADVVVVVTYPRGRQGTAWGDFAPGEAHCRGRVCLLCAVAIRHVNVDLGGDVVERHPLDWTDHARGDRWFPTPAPEQASLFGEVA